MGDLLSPGGSPGWRSSTPWSSSAPISPSPALVWGLADATMAPPRDLDGFPKPTPGARTWRIAHLSDVHVVGERYGFRIESGRSGPQGDARLSPAAAAARRYPRRFAARCGSHLGRRDGRRPLRRVGRVPRCAGRPSRIADRVLVLPGNHDINIVDRANPARLDLSIGPNSRLRKIRTISAINTIQGARVRVMSPQGKGPAPPSPMRCSRTPPTWRSLPRRAALLLDLGVRSMERSLPHGAASGRRGGLGIILLNSNSDSHFSFTNALGMVSVAQVKAIEAVFAQHPKAYWLIGLHHHPVEYPRAAKVLSERVGTTLVNGNWFLRSLQPMANRAVLMHGHRHIDWIGECGGLVIVSAPSPVMEAKNDAGTYFYIHTLEIGADSCLKLLAPQRIDVPGEAGEPRAPVELGSTTELRSTRKG